LDNRVQSTKTSEVGGSYGVMDIVIAATPQLFTAQVSEEERQLALFIDVILKTIHPKLYLLTLLFTGPCIIDS